MKRILPALIMLNLAQTGWLGSLHGQGLVNFNNSDRSRVIQIPEYTFPAPGTYLVGLYFTVDLNAVPNPTPVDGFQLAAVTQVSVSPISALWGLFSLASVEIPGTAAGSQVLLQIRAWSVGYATYADAYTSGDPGVNVGVSEVVGPVTLGGGTTPVPATSGLLTMPIYVGFPEPRMHALIAAASVIALVGYVRKRKAAKKS